MSEHQPQISPQGVKVVALSLTLAPIVYLVILFLLSSMEMQGDPQPEAAFDTILPIAFAVVAVADFFIAYLFFLPKVIEATKGEPTKKNAQTAFSFLLISYTLVEAIGIFGLLIGILQIFVTANFQIIVPSLFIVTSFLLCLYLYMTYVPPLLNLLNQLV